ncbi:DUF7537 family lipoprotein [Halorubrum sp. HHNYT27]|uniref:DUF7537 family lipoprotein n=1 Tax=Halorubrum sp. HHNYT27 TaxID=3402275 RepID=UPI003EBAAA43
MYSGRIRLLVVVLLVVLAGCAGGGDVAPDAEGADSAGGSAGGNDGATGGSAGSGSDGGDEFELGDPESILRDAGSFTVTWSYAGVDANGVETEFTREFYADLASERSYSRTVSATDGQADAGSVERFVADGVTYVRMGSGDDAFVSSQEGSTEVLGTAIALSQARAYDADDDLEFAGTETFDGVTVDRYELSAADKALIQAGSVAAQDNPGTLEITDFEYVVLVDEDGLSRYESWSFSGRTDDQREVSGSWEFSLTAIGATTVEDPDWLDEAGA